jgi:hypothetical protein
MRTPKFRKNLWHAHGNVDLGSFLFEYKHNEDVGGEHEATQTHGVQPQTLVSIYPHILAL